MEVKHDQQGTKGRFFIVDNGTLAGEMTYSRAGDDKFIIDHTEVEDSYRGKSVGLELVKKAVEYGRTNKMKIMPLCPFAKKMFDTHTEFQDVLW